MNDEIEVPIVEIVSGWTVDEIETQEDCDDAFCVLTKAIVGIELRISEMEECGQEGSREHRMAKAALRWKKAALQIINRKYAQIGRREKEKQENGFDRLFVQYVKAHFPDQARQATDAAVWAAKTPTN
ncbi:MAG: hypothetical protein ABF313_09720 [Marivita sp.]